MTSWIVSFVQKNKDDRTKSHEPTGTKNFRLDLVVTFEAKPFGFTKLALAERPESGSLAAPERVSAKAAAKIATAAKNEQEASLSRARSHSIGYVLF